MATLTDKEILDGFAASIDKLREQAQKFNDPILVKARDANPKGPGEDEKAYNTRILELTKPTRKPVPIAIPKAGVDFDPTKFQLRTRDFIKISHFLQSDSLYMKDSLLHLEAAMKEELDKRSLKGTFTGKAADFTPGRDQNHINRHLLTVILGKMEVAEGFSHVIEADGRMKAPAIYGNIGDAFGPLITAGVLAKDYIGGQHGLYTHRIQWYCIAAKKTELTLESMKMGELQKISGIYWNRVFDLPAEDAKDKTDFRRPENLADFLTSDFWSEKNVPLLGGFLKSRVTKGSQQLSGVHYKLLYAKNKLGVTQPGFSSQLKDVYNLSVPNANKRWTELKQKAMGLPLHKELEEIDATFAPNKKLPARVLDATGKIFAI